MNQYNPQEELPGHSALDGIPMDEIYGAVRTLASFVQNPNSPRNSDTFRMTVALFQSVQETTHLIHQLSSTLATQADALVGLQQKIIHLESEVNRAKNASLAAN